MRPADKRTYLDPIHQDIVLDKGKPVERLIVDLIDTKEFQRLRRIHQLGVTNFTFQGAEGSRFCHSVGVMHVASKLIEHLEDKGEEMRDLRALILASALLHDVGHGPYSHVTEQILGYDHEDWSCRIISGDTEIHAVLDKFSEQEDLADQIVKVLKKNFEPHWVSHIVSSQLDCDRFDYLLRDSYMTGTKYGLFALQRILRSLELDHENDRMVVVGEKGQIAVEDYLFARSSMYSQVYYHRKNLAARALLSNLIKRFKKVLSDRSDRVCFVDESTSKWFRGERLSVHEYLHLDDVQLTYHIKRWSEDPDPILSDLSSRFLDRRLFKAIRIPSPSDMLVNDILKEAKRLVADHGLDPEYYTGIESTGFRPYDYYRPSDAHPQTNIMVRTEGGRTTELSKVSLAIEALVKGNYESTWLVFPDEISGKIAVIKELIPAH